jgi:hypothetical protein
MSQASSAKVAQETKNKILQKERQSTTSAYAHMKSLSLGQVLPEMKFRIGFRQNVSFSRKAVSC